MSFYNVFYDFYLALREESNLKSVQRREALKCELSFLRLEADKFDLKKSILFLLVTKLDDFLY